MRLSLDSNRVRYIFSNSRNEWLILSAIILAGVILRIYFFTGHIFSDDAYYARLNIISLQNSQDLEYQGYPIFLLRKLFTWLNSLSFKLFGINEISSVLLPFIVSILNMFLIYFFSISLFEEAKKRLLSVFLLAFFPLEITFASISFPDQMNVFLINLGLFLLYISISRNILFISVIAGLLFSISLLVKENFIYAFIFLLTLLVYKYYKEKKVIYPIIISLSVVVLFLLSESIFYKLTQNDFFYRLTILNQNYKYSWYDFFPYSIEKITQTENYFYNLAYHFVLSFKYTFLRRFYLFIPLFALIFSIYNLRVKQKLLLHIWFLIICFMLIFLPTSISEYKPLNLERSWYFFPLVFPSILIVTDNIFRLKNTVLIPILILYIIGSVIMSNSYQLYFENESKNSFKEFLLKNKSLTIYTDHFTKYGIDLVRGNDLNSFSITNSKEIYFQRDTSSIFVLNKAHIEELKWQGYEFPFLNRIDIDSIKSIHSFGKFKIYALKDIHPVK